LHIDKRYKFPKDSSASILTAGLLGEQYIGLDGGGDDHLLQDGDRLMITQSAVVLEKIIGSFCMARRRKPARKREISVAIRYSWGQQ